MKEDAGLLQLKLVKGSWELFKQHLVMQEANATTFSGVAKIINAINEISKPKATLMPVHLGQTITKQCLTNPHEFGDLEVQFTEKRLDAADAVRTM